MYENRVLKRTYWDKRGEVTGLGKAAYGIA
jgi:hypothetical protein